VVYEAEATVGGIARTVRRGDYCFALGGQAFQTSLEPVKRLWEGLLGGDLVSRTCRAGVYCGGGYLASPTVQAAYPRLGPGQMWDTLGDVVQGAGVRVSLDHRCVALRHTGTRISGVVLRSDGNHLESRVEGVLSSIPLAQLVACLDPLPPHEVFEAARRLVHRSLRVVALMTSERDPFPENWIELRDGDTGARCVHNVGAGSPDMVASDGTCLAVEYPCMGSDAIWTMSEPEAIALATAELARIGLIDPSRVFAGASVSVAQAYPIRDDVQLQAATMVREYLARFANLQTFGRNGLHIDNTQDHSVWTAMLGTENLLDGASHEVWELESDAAGPEPDTGDEATAGGVPLMPVTAGR
jgi:protoporphyrinogen oxidase